MTVRRIACRRNFFLPAMTQAAPPDLSKLRIDRSLAPVVTRRRRRWLWWGGILLVAAVAGGWFALQPRAVTVQTASVVTTYPSQVRA
jgi:hypothetical protein